jgi:hypothetical protein
MIIFNIVFIAGLVAVVFGGLLYAMATQHRDHRAVATGPFLRRSVWSERRPAAVRVEPQARPAQPWLAA